MRKLSEALLWLFVFTVPWDVVTIPGVGTISRLVGLVAILVVVLMKVVEGRLRGPDPIVGVAFLFAFASSLSLLWSLSYTDTLIRVLTYGQLFASVWIIWECARTREQQHRLLIAFWLGAFVPMLDLLNNFRAGAQVEWLTPGRYTATGVNADNVGLMLAIGIPMAWHSFMHSRGTIRLMAAAYCVLAPLAILLTGARGAFLAGLVSLSIIPFTLPRQSVRSLAVTIAVLLTAAVAVAIVVPSSTWDRIGTIREELGGQGTLSGRRDIWRAGWTVFRDHPLLGVGAGAFPVAVEPLLAGAKSPHNVALGVLVDQGLIGFAVFAALIGACAWTILWLEPAGRKLWAVLMLSWLVGSMSISWEYQKITWLLFGLLAARGAVEPRRRRRSRPVASPQGIGTATPWGGGVTATRELLPHSTVDFAPRSRTRARHTATDQ